MRINLIVNAFDKYAKSFSGPEAVAIAVSGGPDSLALVLLLHQWRQSLLISDGRELGRLVALTVNHNLRTAGAAEANYVRQLMEAHGIEHHILTWHPQGPITSNIQCQAREARLGLLTEWCKANGTPNLLLAHTKNDVAETFFINILRGSGIHGLASIPQENLYNGVKLIRPLLETTKDQLKAYLVEQGVKCIDDPSNEDEKFLRVKVRKLLTGPELRKLLPDSVGLLDRIMINVDNIRRVKSFVDESVDQAVAKLVKLSPTGYASIDRQKFKHLHPEIGLHVLTNCLITVSGSHVYGPRLESLQSLYADICNETKSFMKTLWECEIQASGPIVYVYKEIGKKEPELEQLPDGSWLWDQRFHIKAIGDARVDSIERLTPSTLKATQKLADSKPLALPVIKKIAFTLPLITSTIKGKQLYYIPFIEGPCGMIQVEFCPKMNLLNV